jgi:hypothetical protein
MDPNSRRIRVQFSMGGVNARCKPAIHPGAGVRTACHGLFGQLRGAHRSKSPVVNGDAIAPVRRCDCGIMVVIGVPHRVAQLMTFGAPIDGDN